MAEDEWWRSFFSGTMVEFWLSMTRDEEPTRADVDFLQKALEVAPGARVLDVTCGGGRHAVELAARGFDVTGVDLSGDFLRAARELAARRGVSVTWEQREMRDLPWTEQFDGTFCFGNSFGYLDDPGNLAYLHAAARVLKPSGRFVIETGATAESILPDFQERQWYDCGEPLFLNGNRYDHVRGRLETEDTIIRDGNVERRYGFQRVYTYSELCRLLGAAGFGEIEGYGSLDYEPFRLRSPRLLLVATKQG